MAVLPRLAEHLTASVCIVIDVLRASTTLCCMIESGVERVVIADSPPAAHRIAGALGRATLLCGEWDGFKPPDFDYGNSPATYLDARINGKQLVFCSSNGAKALHDMRAAPVTYIGALVNSGTVARHAVQAALTRSLDIRIVCAGDEHGSRFSLEDTFCAGVIALAIVEAIAVPGDLVQAWEETRQQHYEPSPRQTGINLEDSTIAAMQLVRAYLPAPGMAHDPLEATPGNEALGHAAQTVFAQSQSGRFLQSAGFGSDVAFCAQVNSLRCTPRVMQADGLLALIGEGRSHIR